MKIQIELNKEPRKNDLLIYNGEFFEGINKDELLKIVYDYVKQIETMQNDLEQFKINVNDKLKTYHNIIKQLTKEV